MFARAEDVSPSAAAQRRSFYGQLGLESLLPSDGRAKPVRSMQEYEGVL
jgi:hypothetical protein